MPTTKPLLQLPPYTNNELFAFIGRVSLLLIEHNVDAITVGTFLREIADAGGSALRLEQAQSIAQNYAEISP